MELELTKFKSLLAIEATNTDKDELLQFILDDISEIICNYCNLSVVPKGLTNTAYRMAMEVYGHEESLQGTEASTSGEAGVVSKLEEGDTKIEFATNSATSGADYSTYASSILKKYTSQLNRYRRLLW